MSVMNFGFGVSAKARSSVVEDSARDAGGVLLVENEAGLWSETLIDAIPLLSDSWLSWTRLLT